MDAHEVNRARVKLELFVGDVFASVPRKDQRARGDCYLRGLMLDGRRKSIQAMASRLPDGNEQNLQRLVNRSTWDPVPVQRRICERMLRLIDYVPAVRADVTTHPFDVKPVAPDRNGPIGCWPQPRYRQPHPQWQRWLAPPAHAPSAATPSSTSCAPVA